jgi:hypothetical protein
MARKIGEQALRAIEEVVTAHPEGVTITEIAAALVPKPQRRTLQYRLKSLVDNKRLVMEGEGRSARYNTTRSATSNTMAGGWPKSEGTSHRFATGIAAARASASAGGIAFQYSPEGHKIVIQVRKPLMERNPVGYNRAFLDSYRPNESFYLSDAERDALHEIGAPRITEQAAGTFARQILNRLLIDLSWNSSRLEGNTYSLLDTQRLIDLGEEAEGKQRVEMQMILNHKDAIDFLVNSASDITFNRYTILNLHALLANNLLADPAAPGRLRNIGVGIDRSVFHPLEAPQLIEECFDQILDCACAIADPFEQAFFMMVHLPYLQPFDDVNKRVSRLAANIPLIRRNLVPLSFMDVPRQTYLDAVLGVYELNRMELLKDLFLWAYRRSAARYAAVRQSLGEPDPFRLRYREEMREIIGAVIRGGMDKKAALAHIRGWTPTHIGQPDRERFHEIVEDELLSLHEGNFARYQIRPSEFASWKNVWKSSSSTN